MPTVLTVGHLHFLVPDAVNVNVLMKSLEKMTPLRWGDYHEHEERYIMEPKSFTLKMEIVRPGQILDPSKRLPASRRIPEKTSESCNGDMGIS